jgi:phosphate transport system permease protein
MSSQIEKAMQSDSGNFKPQLDKRYKIDQIFKIISWIATFSGLVVLAILLIGVLVDGIPHLSFGFLTSPPSRRPEQAGVWPAFVGSICLLLITAFGGVSHRCGLRHLPAGICPEQ